MLPFFLNKEEKDSMKRYKYRKGIKQNNFPFWVLIFDYLGLEDIEKVWLWCQNFNKLTQDERILEKFIDSDDEEESESEDESNHLSTPPLNKRLSSKKSHSNLVNEYIKMSKKNIPTLSNNESNKSISIRKESKIDKQDATNLSDEMPDFNEQRSRRQSSQWRKLSMQKKRRNTILKIHEENIINKHNKNSMLKLQKVDATDADISNKGQSPISKDKEYTDDEFFKIEERPRKRSIKKSFK